MKEDVPLFFKEPSGKVAFAGIGEEDDDAFILEYGALSDLDCGVQGCAAGNPDKYAGFSGCVSGCVTGVGCRNRHDFVDEIHVQNGGDESGTDALELVWAGVFAGNYCAAIGFDGGDMDLRQYFFQHIGASGEGAAGADAGDEAGDIVIGIPEEFQSGGAAVSFGVGGIIELLHDERAGVGGMQFLSFGDCAGDAFVAGGENQFGTESGEEPLTFHAHGIGHGKDEAVTFDSGGNCQSDRLLITSATSAVVLLNCILFTDICQPPKLLYHW